MNADGSALTQITNAKADDSEPAWSRDGTRIAFVRAMDGNPEIYVVNANGSNESRLAFDPGVDVSPDWSPDGRIFFTSNRDGKRDIYSLKPDGSAVARFTTTGATSPAWSPDRTRIAFVTASPNHWLQVFVADANGGNVTMVTKDPVSSFGPCWSRDGAGIAFAIDNLGVVSNIFEIDLDGSHRRRLTAGPKIDTRAAISPDGSKLAFQSNRDGNYEIYLMNLR